MEHKVLRPKRNIFYALNNGKQTTTETSVYGGIMEALQEHS
jgi:hypothetical protein